MVKKTSISLYVGYPHRKGQSLKKSFVILVIGLLSFLLAFPIYADHFSHGIQSLRKEIEILGQTRTLAISELKKEQTANSKGQLSIYIRYLDSRIADLCGEIVSRGGRTATAGLDCPSQGPLLSGWQTGGGKTNEEQVADLDQRLLEELGRFDEMLATEQEKIASKWPGHEPGFTKATDRTEPSRETKGTNSSTINSNDSDNSSPEKDWEKGSTGRGDDYRSQQRQSNKDNPSQIKGNDQGINSPGNRGLTRDDDIVARQLREAAERETDPRLKKRLWEEYRRYKEGMR